MQYRTKYWLLKIIIIIRNYYEKLLNCYQIAVRDKMLAAHILLHALLSLSLPGPSRSHREENVVDEDNVYSEDEYDEEAFSVSITIRCKSLPSL